MQIILGRQVMEMAGECKWISTMANGKFWHLWCWITKIHFHLKAINLQ